MATQPMIQQRREIPASIAKRTGAAAHKPQTVQKPSYEELEAKLAALEAEKQAKRKLTLKVSEKGAVSVYGLMRFPVTLYKESMLRLLDHADAIRAFIADHEDELATKAN